MNRQPPFISIVVLNWNGLSFLQETIPPLLKLDYPDYEVLVVDNGSTDKSIRFLEKFKKIRIIRNKENLGYSKGKNIGINSAKGKYILSLDNDILIKDKNLLNNLFKSYNNNKKNTGFLQIPLLDRGKSKTYYYGTYYSIYGLNMHRKEVEINKIVEYKKKLIEIVGPTGGFFFVKKSVWKDVGGLDESQKFHIDDVDIGPRSMIFGYKNYLYTRSHATHLGINKTKKADDYVDRFKLVFSGHARSMIKNYQVPNLVANFPLLMAFHFLKAVKYSILKKSINVFIAFWISVVVFIRNLADTLDQRNKIQKRRTIKKDLFIKIKPPKFN